jgi:hypothetical protein
MARFYHLAWLLIVPKTKDKKDFSHPKSAFLSFIQGTIRFRVASEFHFGSRRGHPGSPRGNRSDSPLASFDRNKTRQVGAVAQNPRRIKRNRYNMFI